MQVAVFGATGRTGWHVVRQLLAAGHGVKALVRRNVALDIDDAALAVVTVQSLADPQPLRAALEGCDAVVSAVGPRRLRDGPVASTATRAILQAMEANGISRLVVLSATPLGPVPEHEGRLIRWVLLPLVGCILRDLYIDLARMEGGVMQSATDWTIIRPPRLTAKRMSGRYRARVGGNVPRGYTISRANVAHAMCSALTDPATICQAVGVAD